MQQQAASRPASQPPTPAPQPTTPAPQNSVRPPSQQNTPTPVKQPVQEPKAQRSAEPIVIPQPPKKTGDAELDANLERKYKQELLAAERQARAAQVIRFLLLIR